MVTGGQLAASASARPGTYKSAEYMYYNDSPINGDYQRLSKMFKSTFHMPMLPAELQEHFSVTHPISALGQTARRFVDHGCRFTSVYDR